MRAMVVVFHLPKGSPPSLHRDFRRAVYGEDTSSWGGRYRYRRHGLLDKIPHIRLYWGVVIIQERNRSMLEGLLKRFGAKYVSREVKPTEDDLEVLEVDSR